MEIRERGMNDSGIGVFVFGDEDVDVCSVCVCARGEIRMTTQMRWNQKSDVSMLHRCVQSRLMDLKSTSENRGQYISSRTGYICV